MKQPWFGLPVHRKFKTLIVQNENGRFRLKQEFTDLDCAALDDFVRICPPPARGFAFDEPAFTEALRQAIEAFQPDVVVFNPWNAAAHDDKAADYRAAFDAIRFVIPAGDDAPAIVIVAHTRKPKSDERASGRGLMHTLAGSYLLSSVPRSVFVLQPGSDEPEDDAIIFTCCKNNDGEMGAPSAWRRRNGLFEAVPDFDWQEFAPESKRVQITEQDLRQLLHNGHRTLERSKAVKELMEQTGAKRTGAYEALKPGGRLAHLLRETNGFLTWIGSAESADSPRTANE